MSLRSFAAALLLCLPPAPAAALPAGGVLGGPVRPGGAAAYWNAAALGEFAGRWGGLLDVGTIYLGARFVRAGADPNTGEPYPGVGTRAVAPNPSFTLVAPLKGAALQLVAGGFTPLALSVSWPEDGPQRYSATSSYFIAYTVPVGVAWHPSERLGIAAAVGPMYALMQSAYHMDFGAYANGSMPPGSQPMPLEDPQLEGVAQANASGWSFAATLGAWARPVDWLRVGVSAMWPGNFTLRGDVAVRGSQALEQALPGFKLDATGRITVEYPMAPQVQGEVEATFGDWSVAVIGQDIFSGIRALVPARVSDASIEFLNGDQLALGDTLDDWFVGARLSRRFGADWEAAVRFDYAPRCVPDEATTAGNMDFTLLQLAAGARWRFGDGRWLELAYTYIHPLGYTVANSVLDPYAPPWSGLGSPSGNGDYSAVAHQLSVGILGFGSR